VKESRYQSLMIISGLLGVLEMSSFLHFMIIDRFILSLMLILYQTKESTVSNLPLKLEDFIRNLRGVDDGGRGQRESPRHLQEDSGLGVNAGLQPPQVGNTSVTRVGVAFHCRSFIILLGTVRYQIILYKYLLYSFSHE
jgi:hypothetical protein